MAARLGTIGAVEMIEKILKRDIVRVLSSSLRAYVIQRPYPDV
jgi:hypothetical protein